ncbi:MAG: 23S rRNA (adenine(2503)-C(2))-methyltransferase RlmN [Pseudanabaenaceae cyanobacterium]
MSTATIALLGQSQAELTAWAVAQGQPAYRGQQLHQGIYRQRARSLAEISVLPKTWRETATVEIGRSQIVLQQVAPDGTHKYLLALADGAIVETVGIPSRDRLTVCASTQVGCPMGCTFCATGKGGFARNLALHEILDQVLTVETEMGQRVSHLVLMGMGEPLLNLENVVAAIRSLHRDLGMSQRNITLSTVGLPHKILALAAAKLPITLAVSLHAPNQDLRTELIPSAKHYPLPQLMQDCREYVQQTGRRVSFEYTLLAGTNDRPEHARQLADLVGGFQSHVNLIPYNPIAEAEFVRPDDRAVQVFLQALAKRGVAASVRRTRGLAANAACGQLRGTLQKKAS